MRFGCVPDAVTCNDTHVFFVDWWMIGGGVAIVVIVVAAIVLRYRRR